MFRRSVNLKKSGELVVRVTMANRNQADSYAQRAEHGSRGGYGRGNRRRGGDGNNSEPRDLHEFQASKDNGGQGRQYSNDGSGQNYGNNSRQRTQPGSYPHNERRSYGRGQGHRNDFRQGAQTGLNQRDSQKGDRTQDHGPGTQPDPYQADSQKGNRAQGHGQWPQPGPSQGDSQKGDMDQGNGQGAEPGSDQRDSQEGSGGAQGNGHGTEPGSYQADSQVDSDRGQGNGNDSRQGAQPDFCQKVSQKGSDSSHGQGAKPGCYKGNSLEGNDMGQGHGNDSRQDSYQEDSHKGSDRGQNHGNEKGEWNKLRSNQGSWRSGGDSSGGHYQDNRSQSYQGQKDSGQEGRYSRQASSGSGFRGDNFDQQQRKRNRVDDEDDTFLSKTLSFILRHGAEKLKFRLMPGGFLYVDEILKKMQKLEGFTEEDVKRIVAQNDKQRFALQKDEGSGRLKIRANQGHTVEVEDLELTKIESADQAPVVLHGTYYDAWNSIKTQGLYRFKRNHIHFAAGEPGETGVISGMRSSCQVLIYIDLEKALKDGLKFYLSANNVILSPGNEKGYIYPCYFKAVLNRYPYHMIQFDPNIKGKTVSADQIADELDKKDKKKKKKKSKKNKEDRENDESGVPGQETEDVGDTNLFAAVGEKLKEEKEKGKEKEEGKDEEDHFEDAMETQPEKLIQSNVPDQWDEVDKVEHHQQVLTNSKGAEQSKGTQEVAESEEPKGTKESKTKEKDSWSEASKGASKSKASSKPEAPKEATKSEASQRSVIPKGEQKATKNEASEPEIENEGADTALTDNAEDVKIEEEWIEVSITNAEESQSAVDYIMEQKQKEPVSIICCGEKQGDADGKIAVLVIGIQGKSWIYQLCNLGKDIMEAGRLKQLFFDTDLMKVFHDVTWQSAVLFKQFEIVLDGTKVFDSKVVCQLKLLDSKAMNSLRLEGFMPTRWVEENSKIDSSKWTQNPLDKDLSNKLVERCKAQLQFYRMFTTMKKLSQPKKEIYAEVNKYVDSKRAKEIKKIFKSQAKNTTSQEQSALSSKDQTKGPGSPKKKKNKKGK